MDIWNLSTRSTVKLTGMVGLLCLLVSFQNCDKYGNLGNGDMAISCVIASRIMPRLYVNDVLTSFFDNHPPLSLTQGQDVTFRISVGESPNCKTTTREYWQLPDGSKIFNYCATLNQAQAGSFTVEWVSLPMENECGNPKPWGISVDFTVQ